VAALGLALLSIRYRLWSHRGCCLSGGTLSPSYSFGNSHPKQTCSSGWWCSLYSWQSASHAATSHLQRLKVPFAKRTLWYSLPPPELCLKMHRWSKRRSTSFSTTRFVWRCQSSRIWDILPFLIGISRRTTITTLCVEGIWRIFEDRLPIVIYTGHSILSPAKSVRCVTSDMKIKGSIVSHTLSVA